MPPPPPPPTPLPGPRPAPHTLVRSLDSRLSPGDAIRAWPSERPLVCLYSGEPGAWSRWTILAEPREWVVVPAGPAAGADPMRALAAAVERTRLTTQPCPPSPDTPPFLGGWIGYLGYELGRVLEPAAGRGVAGEDDRGWPLMAFARCAAAYAYDGVHGVWYGVGESGAVAGLPPLGGRNPAGTGLAFRVGSPVSRTGESGYIAAAARTVEYIHAGDIFQANIAHRLTAGFAGSGRGLFVALAEASRPWFGGYLEVGDGPDGRRRIVASVSPELFLAVEGAHGEGGGPGEGGVPNTGGASRVVTRPIKGTRRADADPADLAGSPKDRAELNMIIDLMRNDLGRVCRYGSVRVDDARAIERHAGGGVLHGVATVSGELRPGVGVPELLRATFPPGSVTGAPKIRAMQIIGELEPVARGPYCGSIGYISDCGRAAFNVAIRTALLSGRAGGGGCDDIADGRLDYSVGAGVVADSDPAAEWRETLDKAGVLFRLTDCGHLTNEARSAVVEPVAESKFGQTNRASAGQDVRGANR